MRRISGILGMKSILGGELGGFSEFYPLVPQIPVFFPEF